MNQQQPGLWCQVIANMVGDNVSRFRFRHACVLVGVGAVHVAAVLCCDLWDGFPRWPLYLFTAALVIDALLHSRINRGYENSQVQAWHDLLSLTASVQEKAQSGTAKPSQPGPSTKPVLKPVPTLRVYRPDEEPSQNGAS